MFPCHNYIANDNTLHQLLLQGRRQNLRARPSCQPLQRFRRQIQRSVHGKQNAQSHRNGLPGSHLTSTSTVEIAIDCPRNARDVTYVATPAKEIAKAMMQATLWIQTAEQDEKTARYCGILVFSTLHGSVYHANQRMFFKQRIRKLKKAEYKKVASPTFFKHRVRSLKKSLSAATGHRTSTATGQ